MWKFSVLLKEHASQWRGEKNIVHRLCTQSLFKNGIYMLKDRNLLAGGQCQCYNSRADLVIREVRQILSGVSRMKIYAWHGCCFHPALGIMKDRYSTACNSFFGYLQFILPTFLVILDLCSFQLPNYFYCNHFHHTHHTTDYQPIFSPSYPLITLRLY